MANRKRDVQILLWVTPEEKKMIRKRMILSKTSNMSVYLRKMAIDGMIVNTDTTYLKAMHQEMHKIGVNINQLAKVANTVGTATPQDIEELKEKLYGIVKEIHSARFPYNDFLYQDYTENNADIILPDGCVAPDVTLSRIDSLCTYTTADHGLVMRKGPGTNYEKMDNIPYGIIVWECGYSSNVPDWVVVYYSGIYGWVSDEYLAATIYSTSK